MQNAKNKKKVEGGGLIISGLRTKKEQQKNDEA